MKKRYLFSFLLLTFLVVAFIWWNRNTSPVSESSDEIRFVIPRGYGATQIANKLEDNNLIRSSLAFKIFVSVGGQAKKIQAGEYDLSPSLTLRGLVSTLLKGPREVWVTIPEGLRREEVGTIFADGLELEGQARADFIADFLVLTKDSEGFLFPDTYLFPKDTTAEKVVTVLSNTFERKVADFRQDIDSSGYSLNQLVTLASLIERESATDEERPLVAGVLYNRLEANWPLQVDAAVQYATANVKCPIYAEATVGKQMSNVKCEWWPVLTKEDLEVNSPYNTYKYTGLPPAPIANPGLSSLAAAINPQENGYWFYLHDPEGEIHFAETIEEHNANVRKYLGK